MLFVTSMLAAALIAVTTAELAHDMAAFAHAEHELLEVAPRVGDDFSLSKTLGDHMVLQRAPVSAIVWGFAPEGTTVTTTFGKQTIVSKADANSTWRAALMPTPASATTHTISFAASTGETATLSDVLFGDVYVCGGQSNMQFSLGGNENISFYKKEADQYPNIRLFTVGQKTSSKVPLMDLHTVEQNWTRAAANTVTDGSAFNYFSAVCWFFGKNLYDGLGGSVPIGLVNDNWGGTRVEQWTPPETTAHCGHLSSGELYNAMIVPYSVGPMAVSGFTWYQGESDLAPAYGTTPLDQASNNYSCTQTAMIEHWRKMYQVPSAFYAVVQLSTWLPDPQLLAELRDQQLESGDEIPNFAYATNADYGAGSNIHPPFKQHCGQRLANAALSIVYEKGINWRSPTYATAQETGGGEVTVWLHDVLEAGLTLKDPHNRRTSLRYYDTNCTAANAKAPGSCAWASIQFDDQSWVNATVGLTADKQSMVLSAAPPSGAKQAIATSYGWGSIPMMTVYRADMEGEDGQLPVLAWNRTIQ
jgi:sialate O-acetylesterase